MGSLRRGRGRTSRGELGSDTFDPNPTRFREPLAARDAETLKNVEAMPSTVTPQESAGAMSGEG